MSGLSDEILAMRHRAWTTSGSRYNAARRLRSRSKLSIATISLLSALGIAVPILASVTSLAHAGASLALYSSLLALLVLVVGIIEGGAGFELKAVALHRNAEALNAFRTRINVALSDASLHSTSLLYAIAEEYEEIKNRCEVNHEPVDYNLIVATHPAEFNSGKKSRLNFTAFQAYVFYYLHSTWWLLLIWIISVAGLCYFWKPA